MPGWKPIKTALCDPLILTGDRIILACDNRVDDGFCQVVWWDRYAAQQSEPKGCVRSGFGWTTMEGDAQYDLEFFTHWIYLPPLPVVSVPRPALKLIVNEQIRG